MDAQVSAYAISFGSSYSFVKASPSTVEPIPPVIYIFFSVMLFHRRSQASKSFSSYSVAARSAMAVYI